MKNPEVLFLNTDWHHTYNFWLGATAIGLNLEYSKTVVKYEAKIETKPPDFDKVLSILVFMLMSSQEESKSLNVFSRNIK